MIRFVLCPPHKHRTGRFKAELGFLESHLGQVIAIGTALPGCGDIIKEKERESNFYVSQREGLTRMRPTSIIRNHSGLEAMELQEIKRRIIEGMKEKALRLTRQRLEIIDILAREKSHPSAHFIFMEARKKEPSISLSTVYLTLDIMKRAGLIKELEFDDRDSRYEGDISDHLNLVCTSCGRIEDFPASKPVPLEKIEIEAGFRADTVRFECYGLCRECRAKRG
jgi:Fur family transcriptional regulator, peroxide stress response regulator